MSVNHSFLSPIPICFLILVLVCSVFKVQAQSKAQSESGVVLKAGIHSTIFQRENATLISNGSAGYTIGFDGLFYDGKFLIQPGIHLMTFPNQQTGLKSAFKDVFTRPDSSYQYGFKMPIRVGTNLVDIGIFRLKGTFGLYGFYSHDGIVKIHNEIEKKCHVSGGWTLNVGLIIKFLSLEIDYDSTFGKADNRGPMYMRTIGFTAGLVF